MTAEPPFHDIGRTGILHRCGAKAIEAKYGLPVLIINSQERLGPAGLMAFSGMLTQETVQGGVAAIEGLAVVLFADGSSCQGGRLICAWAEL